MLGGEIASIEENFYGVMEKTRVYAGGAVIGEQQRWTATGQSTGETYSYIFRDPVSGSVIRGGLEEHYEPLGQKIDPVPPLEDPTFPGPNDGFNDARFPEWQCQAAAARQLSGSELPAHCQRAAEQRNIAAKMFDVTWPAWPEKDGNALKLADSPLFNGAGGDHASLSFATRTMSASLTTTTKRFKDDEPDCDTQNCVVDVTADLDLPEDFKDASFNAGWQTQNETQPIEVSLLNGNCGVNPVTGLPGIPFQPISNPWDLSRPGGLGNLRPGKGGAGGFRERSYGQHDAIDIVAPKGTSIVASLDGHAKTGTSTTLGKYVIIYHGGFSTLYAHLDSISIKAGRVEGGIEIGKAGITGNASDLTKANGKEDEQHVHFGVFSGKTLPTSGSSSYRDPVTFLNDFCPPRAGGGPG